MSCEIITKISKKSFVLCDILLQRNERFVTIEKENFALFFFDAFSSGRFFVARDLKNIYLIDSIGNYDKVIEE